MSESIDTVIVLHLLCGGRIITDMEALEHLSGKFLIAMPDMGDPRFAGAVIYVCSHSEDGAMGLIVNKPNPDLRFGKLLEQMKISKSPACRDIRVHFGGPVERARGFVLHSMDYTSDGNTMEVEDGIGMTGTLDVLEALAKGEGPATSLLALGYAGWGPGQLEAELMQNGWLTGPARQDILFGRANEHKWAAALKLLGVDPSMLSASGGRA